mgnify:CR=1 FL=1
MLITVLSMLGCGSSEPPPTATPQGRLCGRAYGSTIDSLDELYTKAGKDMPTPIKKDEYVKMCVDMKFTDEQLKCLDPKIAQVDEACVKTLEPVKEKTSKLAKALIPKKEEKKDGEKKEGEDKKEDGK